MSYNALTTPQQAWVRLKSFWNPFSFMLSKGASPEQINIFQKKEDVLLQPRIIELISIYSTIGIPTESYGYFCAETALMPIAQWSRFDNSILNKEQDDPSFWPEVFSDYNCPSTSMNDYIVVGSDPWGADYGIYLMLHQKSNTIFGIN
ncbi:MAG: hypothetical protein PF481_04025 [Bacteroidales bacterium]|jgi:hypothetical protein|nr:hypothetical protein [Bacteroidales bacterium]